MEATVQQKTDSLHPVVASLDFRKIAWKLCESGKAKMTKKECEAAEKEYRRFLTLKKLYPGAQLVPSKLLDEFWHAHILDTVAYHKDCQTVFGKYLHHFPYFGIYGEEDHANLVAAFEKTKALYEKHFGRYPEELDTAARCQGDDHKCHSPKECACRGGPGACK